MKNNVILIALIICLIFTGCEKYVENTCPYSIMVDDVIYYYTDESPSDIKDVKITGKITSVIPESKMPSKNSQANIGTVGAPYGKYKDCIIVLINDKWVLFESRSNETSSDNNNEVISHKREKSVPVSDSTFDINLSFAGTIIEENQAYLIVEPNEDEDVRKISDRLYVQLKDIENRDYLYGEGQKVVIYYIASPKSAVFEITATKILPYADENIGVLPADDWGLVLNVINADTTGASLSFLQCGGNPTGQLQFGEEYIIEKKCDNAWVPLDYQLREQEVTWHAIAYQIPKNDTCEFDINWEFLYGKLELGTVYRIGKKVMDFRQTGDYDTKMYYAEFAIID